MIFINMAKHPVELFPTLNVLKAAAAACGGDPPLSLRDAVALSASGY